LLAYKVIALCFVPWVKIPLTNLVSTDDNPTPVASKTVDELAQEVLAGNWGNGEERKNRLSAAGYDYDSVQAKVNELCGVHNEPLPVNYTVKSGDTLSAITRQ
jgi:LysM repeat protein